MKILIFSTAYLPFVGGAELAIKEITDRLPEYSFTLITARFRRSLPTFERLGNVEVYRVGFGTSLDKWLLPWLGLRKAQQLETTYNSQTNPSVSLTVVDQKVQGFDVIWTVMASQASVAAAWFKELHPDKKLVLTLQEGDEEEHLKRYVFGVDFLYRLFIRPWHLLVFKQADAITAISSYLAERARKNNTDVPITVVPNGVDLAKFQIPSTKSQTSSHFSKEEIKHKVGFKPEDKVIITTSRLVEKNGVGDLISAMRYLPEHVNLLICGDGPLNERLKIKVERLKLEKRVIFLGYISHAELPEYLHAADVFCRPSLSEGMGSSFIEAMAAGLPVVATPVGGIVDFLCDPSSRLNLKSGERFNIYGQTGLFCEVGSPKSIAEKVKLLLSNNELRNRIVANGSNMVREKYEWNDIAKKMESVLTGK